MEHVKGWEKLNEKMKFVFMKVYKRHLNSMGKSEQEKHQQENIVKIKVNQKEQCFETHYKHEWYKYYADGTWG